jgi:3-phosphoshikimate 1-carboxyvinyltransferase
MKITPARRIRGRVRVPGDKSISHRAAIIASLAAGSSRITNFSPSEDCAATLSCLEQLGVAIERDGESIRVDCGHGLSAPSETLDCGNSGSTIRMLAGVLAGQNFVSTLSGDHSLRSRPMKRIIEPLERMGAKIRSCEGKPPLTVAGTSALKAIRYELPVPSAQVKTCVLLAGLHAEGVTEIIETRGETRDHTERMLACFGVPIKSVVADSGFVTTSVSFSYSFSGHEISIPGDISSAAFLIAAAALLPDSRLHIEGVGLNPTRTMFLTQLQSFGLATEIEETRAECNEPVGDVHVTSGLGLDTKGKPIQVRGDLIPRLIDELPMLAVVGTQLQGGIEIRDAGELRSKESDRISATVRNLRAMGAEVEEYDDGVSVAGPTLLRGARIESYSDHRIAMAFTVAALIAQGDSEIAGAGCVAVSFPTFFDMVESIVER